MSASTEADAMSACLSAIALARATVEWWRTAARSSATPSMVPLRMGAQQLSQMTGLPSVGSSSGVSLTRISKSRVQMDEQLHGADADSLRYALAAQ